MSPVQTLPITMAETVAAPREEETTVQAYARRIHVVRSGNTVEQQIDSHVLNTLVGELRQVEKAYNRVMTENNTLERQYAQYSGSTPVVRTSKGAFKLPAGFNLATDAGALFKQLTERKIELLQEKDALVILNRALIKQITEARAINEALSQAARPAQKPFAARVIKAKGPKSREDAEIILAFLAVLATGLMSSLLILTHRHCYTRY